MQPLNKYVDAVELEIKETRRGGERRMLTQHFISKKGGGEIIKT